MTTDDIVSALLDAGLCARRHPVGTAEVIYTSKDGRSVGLSVHQGHVFGEFYRRDLPEAEDAPIATFATIDEAVDAVLKWFEC